MVLDAPYLCGADLVFRNFCNGIQRVYGQHIGRPLFVVEGHEQPACFYLIGDLGWCFDATTPRGDFNHLAMHDASLSASAVWIST
jgi:hypothetical protein